MAQFATDILVASYNFSQVEKIIPTATYLASCLDILSFFRGSKMFEVLHALWKRRLFYEIRENKIHKISV